MDSSLADTRGLERALDEIIQKWGLLKLKADNERMRKQLDSIKIDLPDLVECSKCDRFLGKWFQGTYHCIKCKRLFHETCDPFETVCLKHPDQTERNCVHRESCSKCPPEAIHFFRIDPFHRSVTFNHERYCWNHDPNRLLPPGEQSFSTCKCENIDRKMCRSCFDHTSTMPSTE